MNPNARASELIDATESIITIIEQENTLLKESRVDEIEPLVETKKSLVDMYEYQVRDAAQHKGFLDEIDADMRTKLEKSNERFEDAVRKNVNALRAAMTVNHQIVETIARSIENQQVAPAGYSSNGQGGRAQADKSKMASKIAFTLNEEF
ncbi:MAG: hypothetical protein CMM48_18690 [Rhodospirillaceae bacterium]|nr:hypothetical protein [Rhodospirillaceae bacterium]HAA93298.1 hypothetical protein [Rhodospirillaceae bacterium]|tara:strand:+ start:144 stop:593 length:450 start_codon:yes stop_codon:yes gene_type:complete